MDGFWELPWFALAGGEVIRHHALPTRDNPVADCCLDPVFGAT
jgi:hypothetical protein